MKMAMDAEQATHTAVTLMAGMAAATDEAEEALRVGDLAALLEALEARERLQPRVAEATAALLASPGSDRARHAQLLELVRSAAVRLRAGDARLQIAMATERQEVMMELERVDASNTRSGRYHGGRATAGGTIDFRR